MATVYIETTVIGYLTSRIQRDPIVAGHQALTRQWWDGPRLGFETYVSEAVLREISAGDPVAAAERIEAARGIPLLDTTPEIYELAREYRMALGLPDRAATDSVHMAYAVTYEIDYLVTWNCTHIANGDIMRRLLVMNNAARRFTPLMVTPESLIG